VSAEQFLASPLMGGRSSKFKLLSHATEYGSFCTISVAVETRLHRLGGDQTLAEVLLS